MAGIRALATLALAAVILTGCSASRVQPDSTPKSDAEQAADSEAYEREWVEARTVTFQQTLPSGKTVECVAFNGAGLWCMEVAK